MKRIELDALIEVFGPKAKVVMVEKTCKLIAEMGNKFRAEGAVLVK